MGQYSREDTIRRIEYDIGYAIDPDQVRTDEGQGWDGQIQNGVIIVLTEPIIALLICSSDEKVVKLGRDSPLLDINSQIYEWWRLLAHQVQAWWRQVHCEDIERKAESLEYYAGVICGLRIGGRLMFKRFRDWLVAERSPTIACGYQLAG
jgi:hypothetical protein